MKVIFLDIDGVLVNRESLRKNSGFKAVGNQGCIRVLNKILGQTGAVIVISSSWRLFYSLDELRLILKTWGVSGEIIDKTPDLSAYYRDRWDVPERGDEIWSWLGRHREVTSFVVIDDDMDMNRVVDKLIRTEFEIGLTENDGDKAIEILG